MSTVSHRAAGLVALRRRLASLAAAAEMAVQPAFGAVADRVAEDVKTTLGDASTPSPPGGPPADPSGRLAATVSAASNDAAGLGATVTVSAPFARFLEYGTRRMAARPFLRPAALRMTGDARALLAAVLRRGLIP